MFNLNNDIMREYFWEWSDLTHFEINRVMTNKKYYPSHKFIDDRIKVNRKLDANNVLNNLHKYKLTKCITLLQFEVERTISHCITFATDYQIELEMIKLRKNDVMKFFKNMNNNLLKIKKL